MKFLFDVAQVDEEALRRRAREVLPHVLDKPLGRWVREVNTAEGADFASMLLWEWCRQSAANGEFYHRFHGPLDAGEAAPPPDLRVLLLPTMFYKEHPELGGDGVLFSQVAAAHGIKTELVPLHSLGGVDRNADVILDFFRRMDSADVWVISFSKGSADLKRALLKDGGLILPKLKGWLNVGGTVGGTHITDRGGQNPIKQMMMKSWIRLRGGAAELTEEIGWHHPFSRAVLRLPSSVQVINVVGLPLRCHLRKPLVTTYAHLAQWGPNEGFLMFEDAVSIGGNILPLWGADHYLRVPELSTLAHQFFRRLAARTTVPA